MIHRLIYGSLLSFVFSGMVWATPALRPVPESSLTTLQLVDDGLLADRQTLLTAIDFSLSYLSRPSSQRFYPIGTITHDRMVRSLRRFRELVVRARTPGELSQRVRDEFTFYQSIGRDNRGTVLFTAYYEPVFKGSRTRSDRFRFPLFRLPPNLADWPRPHPPRRELETTDRLRGLELVWLADPMEAFLIHVQGSARLILPNNQVMTVGYAGKTDRPYTSIGRELVRDGRLTQEEVNLPRILQYFQENPQELMTYLHRNESFIFFRETEGRPATGSLGVPVSPDRSIATDRSLMPPGGLALISTVLPFFPGNSPVPQYRRVSRFVLDQDVGSAIRGPGRVDIFMGTGQRAQDRAGLVRSEGQLFYLLLRE